MSNARLADFATRVHEDFADELSFARVWGHGKHDGQRIHRDHPLADGDVIELHL
ncbi:MAG: TGS domain-containing protein [Deltaproteobacteria bacterium]|nr:TGS domain-containing protein [Deltaproteobacteria bacterium]